MPYAYTNLTTALSDLGARLYDLNSVFWSNTEKTRIIQTALRTWNAFTSLWRSEFTMPTQANVVWYDIANLITAPNTLRAYTVLDTDLYKIIEDHLLEPATGAAWTGSLQFNAQDMIQAVQRRRDELTSNTSCTVQQHVVAANPGRTFLPDSTLDIRRIAWLPVGSPAGFVNSPLWPDDVWAMQSYERDFTTQAPGTPSIYRQSTEPPLSFDVDILPAVPGQYECLTIDAGAALDPNNPSTLAIPDDFTWLLVFGAMGDMLNRESNAKDALRAQYCNARYAQGMALLKNSPALLYARSNNLQLDIDSAQNQDDFNPSWQSQAATTPDTLLVAGLNLIGFSPTPDAGPYSVTLGVVQNAPIPIVGKDLIQIGRDDYDVLLDYCVHLASFKMGGAEFVATIPLFQRFMKQATLYNSKLDELGEFTKTIYELSQLQAETNPVFSDVEPTAQETT